LNHAPALPRSYGQRLKLAEGIPPHGLPCHCTDKAGNVFFVPLKIFRSQISFLLPRQRRGAAGSGLGTTAKYLRQKTSGAAGNSLGATIKYLRRSTSGAADNGMGTTMKYLRRATSGAASNGLSRHQGIFMRIRFF
jgi:hypothetical protein